MEHRRLFKQKFGDRMIILGLSSLAVLVATTEKIGKLALSFPSHGTSFGQAIRNVERAHQNSSSVKEYLDFLKDISGYNLSVILHRLKAKGLVRKEGNEYRPTRKGRFFLKKVSETLEKNSRAWDGKWRLITFDIPEKFRKERNWLRHSLQTAQYKMLHRSVFVGKFPLDEDLYKSIYRKKLDGYMRILTVGEIDEDNFD